MSYYSQGKQLKQWIKKAAIFGAEAGWEIIVMLEVV